MQNNDNRTLYVIDGDYGLVSVDVECIQSILLAKVSDVPINITVLNNLKSCLFYNAPSLMNGKVYLNNSNAITSYLMQSNHNNIDKDLNSKQQSDLLAIKNLVLMKLKPVFEFIYWIDQRNVDELITRWFMKALPLPFNYNYVNRKKNAATQMIETLYPHVDDVDVIKDYFNKTASYCLGTLSTKLGSSQYFLGNTLTSLDILIYAYLSPLIKLPLPSNEITALINTWPNLAEFVKRIDMKYFPDLTRDVKYLKIDDKHRQDDDKVSYMAIGILLCSIVTLGTGFLMRMAKIKH